MNILCVSLTGTTRAKILANMLKSELFETDTIGINDLYSHPKIIKDEINKINKAQMIILIDEHISTRFFQFFRGSTISFKNTKFIHLNIPITDNEEPILEEFNYKTEFKKQLKGKKFG